MMDTSSFKSCSFCPNEKLDLYKCPQCSSFYCSLRCFRCKKHIKCSEDFYRKECEKHNELLSNDSSELNPTDDKQKKTKVMTFEQYMAQQNQNCGKRDKSTANPQIAVRADEEVLFDSDDEPEYLSKMIASSLEQFNSLDDQELDRRILNAGLPIGLGEEQTAKGETSQEEMERLYQQLTGEEKKKFTELADGIFHDELANQMNSHLDSIMANRQVEEQRQTLTTEPKKKVFERDFLRMATLTNDVMFLRRTLERDDLYELLLCLFGSFTCEKAFETAEHLEAFVAKHCPSIRIETVGMGADMKKFFHWDPAGDQPQKKGLDRMANGTAINGTFEGENESEE
ncbi:hypothetical protein niasHT_010346 [Heterodera trifolii]|uniref:HIT-type domain-containing protein n=1 Tax=Heterodera trifolii TaxID=157864 RepID=A0ABD2M6W9_9BILA